MRVNFPVEIRGDEIKEALWQAVYTVGYWRLVQNKPQEPEIRDRWPEAWDAGEAQAWKDYA